MYLGRYRIGEYVPLAVWCRNAAGTPTLPDIAPTAIIYTDEASLLTIKIPICDKYHQTGFFLRNFYLNSRFVDSDLETGFIRVLYQYTLSSVSYSSEDVFEIIAGGSTDGVGISSYFYRRPQQSFVLVQAEGGSLLKKRNPRI